LHEKHVPTCPRHHHLSLNSNVELNDLRMSEKSCRSTTTSKQFHPRTERSSRCRPSFNRHARARPIVELYTGQLDVLRAKDKAKDAGLWNFFLPLIAETARSEESRLAYIGADARPKSTGFRDHNCSAPDQAT